LTRNDKAYFAITSNSWSNNKIGLAWLGQVFERYTKPTRASTKRFLIVDSHSSYINIEFIDFADHHNIMILILFLYIIHPLQHLDMGLFQPLVIVYSWELERLMNEGKSRVSMSKRFFWSIFKKT
jgi:hypothetical protein